MMLFNDIRVDDSVEQDKHGLSFPYKLFLLMEHEENNVVKWAPHGFAFIINNQDKLLKDILPKYFKHTKLTSFQRQLNLYGFRRLTKGEDQGAYFHPKFQRNRKDLLAEIHRLPGKGTLSTLEQVISASRNLPSERFCGIKKMKPEKEDVQNSITKVNLSQNHNYNNSNNNIKTIAKVSPPRVYASSNVITNMNNNRPMTKSKLTMNIGFTFKPQTKNEAIVNKSQILLQQNINNLNNNFPMHSIDRSGSLNDIIQILHPNENNNNNSNSNNNDLLSRTDSMSYSLNSSNFNSTDNFNSESISLNEMNIINEKNNFDNENLLKTFDIDNEQFYF